MNTYKNQLDKEFVNANEEAYNAIDDNFEVNNANGDFEAAGDAGEQEVSSPLIFTLDNTTAGTLTDVSFLEAFKAIAPSASNSGVTAGVTVTYDISGISYVQALQAIAGGTSFRIRKLYIECQTSSQLTKAITVTTSNLTGKTQSKTLYPVIQPSNQQTTVATCVCDFVLDKFTKLTIASLQSTNDLTLRLYPQVEMEASRKLQGKSETKTNAGPGIKG